MGGCSGGILGCQKVMLGGVLDGVGDVSGLYGLEEVGKGTAKAVRLGFYRSFKVVAWLLCVMWIGNGYPGGYIIFRS